MAGGLLRISAYGAQDVFLTGDPQITFFKALYKRYTHFSMETIQQQFSGTAGFGKKDVASTISKNGDLVTHMVLQIDLPALTGNRKYVDNLGHAIIDRVRINVGGDPIDEHQGRWLEIWDELTQDENHRTGYEEMIAKVAGTGGTNGEAKTLFIPLQFWFCRHPGLALPLVALQYSDVKVIFSFKDLYEITVGFDDKAQAEEFVENGNEMKASFFVDYVYLDTVERSGFAQRAHEYLIDQVQGGQDEDVLTLNAANETEQRIKLNFSHPVMELIWVFENPDDVEPFRFTFEHKVPYVEGGGHSVIEEDIMKSAKLQINGHDQSSMLPAKFHRLVTPYKFHTRIPHKPVYVFSFSLKPEDTVQPHGTCNFSRIDNAYLIFQLTSNSTTNDEHNTPPSLYKCYVYARSYNLFKVVSGRGAMQYSN